MPLFFDKQPANGIEDMVSAFGPRALASPYRSTVPLIALVKDEPGIFSGIVKRCGAGPEFNVHFEYKTALPGVEGNPSQTDAMVLSPKAALAVEAIGLNHATKQ